MGEPQFVRLRAELNPESQTHSEKRPTRERARRLETGSPRVTAANQRKGGRWLKPAECTAGDAGGGRPSWPWNNHQTLLQYYTNSPRLPLWSFPILSGCAGNEKSPPMVRKYETNLWDSCTRLSWSTFFAICIFFNKKLCKENIFRWRCSCNSSRTRAKFWRVVRRQ